MKAWRTVWDQVPSIVIAETRAKAVWITMLAIEDANYHASWVDIRARRAPEFDHLADPLPCGRRAGINTAMTPEWARRPCRCTKCEEARDR